MAVGMYSFFEIIELSKIALWISAKVKNILLKHYGRDFQNVKKKDLREKVTLSFPNTLKSGSTDQALVIECVKPFQKF